VLVKNSVDVEAGDNHRFVPRLSMAVTEFYMVLRIEKKAMVDTLHREHTLSDLFVAYLLTRNTRYEEDLVDQLFNSSEKTPVSF
jgi:hypothetical protein